MRKKAGSWMIKVILGVIVIVFVFWGVGSFRDDAVNSIASVNGEDISLEEYRTAYNNLLEMLRQNYGNNLSEDLIKAMGVRKQALDQIIDRKLLASEAKRLKLRVADEEVIQSIQSIPVFQRNGAFDPRAYQTILERYRTTPEMFEFSQRENMLIGKLRGLVNGNVHVSELEARQWYDWSNATVNIEYVLFKPADYKDIEVTDEEIQAHFDENKETYKTQPERKVQYLRWVFDDFKKDLQVADEKIAAYYESHPDEFKVEKTVQARHILFKVAEDADEETVEAARKKAADVHKLASDGEDFAELATLYSEGPTKDKGGDLGTFKKQDMVAPFAEKAFAMAAGEVSEPVRTRFGWHVIKLDKVNEASNQTLEEATETIRKNLTDEMAKAKAYDAAEMVYEESFDGDDLKEIAETRELPLHTTEFFSRNGIKEKLADRFKFAQAAFQLVDQEISEVQNFRDGYYMLQVLEEKTSAVPPLDDVKDRVRNDMVRVKQDQKALADADLFLEEAKKDEKDFAQVCQEKELTPAITPFFKRNDTIPDIGSEQGISAAAFQLSAPEQLNETAVKGRQGYYVFRMLERKLPEPEGYADEKEGIENNLRSQKQNGSFQALLEKLKEKSEISIQEGFIE
jgi:peptidyl-prolyl cis-trans isomerase D